MGSTLDAIANAQKDFQNMRYTLALTLMSNGFYDYDEFLVKNPKGGLNDGGHQTTFWYDEYDNSGKKTGYLGNPLKGKENYTQPLPGVLRRDFEHGIVLVNKTQSPQIITLDGTYQKLTASGRYPDAVASDQLPKDARPVRQTADITGNDGSIVYSITLPPRDGIILLRTTPAIRISGTPRPPITISIPTPTPTKESSATVLANKEVSPRTENKLIILGDSITHRMAKDPKSEIVNLGVDSTYSSDGLKSIKGVLSTYQNAKFIGIAYGANNASHSYYEENSPDNFRKDLNAIIDNIINAGGVPVLSTITAPIPANRYDVTRYNLIIKQVIKDRGLPSGPDLYQVFNGHPKFYNADGIHESEMGGQEILSQWKKVLDRLASSSSADSISDSTIRTINPASKNTPL